MPCVPCSSADGTHLELELRSESTSVAKARHAVSELAKRAGTRRADVELAVTEAVGNAVIHAFEGREPGTITVTGGVYGSRLIVTVADDGNGMQPRVDSPGLGLGLSLITKIADEVRVESSDRGTTLSMAFAVRDREAQG